MCRSELNGELLNQIQNDDVATLSHRLCTSRRIHSVGERSRTDKRVYLSQFNSHVSPTSFTIIWTLWCEEWLRTSNLSTSITGKVS